MLWKPGKSGPATRSTERLPPGQKLVKGLPILHEGQIPRFDPQTWKFSVTGLVANPGSLSWQELLALPKAEVVRDFHCVTTWSRYDTRWGGVGIQEILSRFQPLPEAKYVLVHCYDDPQGTGEGYTTNLALADLAMPDNMLALSLDGAPLTPEHGGPVRLVVHHLYAWKSAKWVCGLEFLAENKRGFWEERGYHNRADPWLEERYSYQETGQE